MQSPFGSSRPRGPRVRQVVVAPVVTALFLVLVLTLAVRSPLVRAETVVATIPVGNEPVAVGVNPTTNRIYVADQADDTLSVVDGMTDTVVATIPVGNVPVAVGVNPTTNRIYVANLLDNAVSVVNGTTDTVVATIPVGNEPVAVGVNPTTNRIYVTNQVDDTVSVVDGTTDTVVATIPVGDLPYRAGVNPTTNRIYVANLGDDTVWVIDGSPPTPTPTNTPTPTATSTPTDTPTPTVTSTPTSTPASTSTTTSSATPTATPTLSPTPTPPPPPSSASPPAPAPAHIDWAHRIAIVWPHGSASTSQADAPFVNVSVWPSVAVPCRVDPTPPIDLFVARNHEPASRVGNAPRLIERTVGEARFPSLEFDDVPTSLSANPNARDSFFSVVDGQPTGNVWVHAADPRTILPQPLTPTGHGAASPPAVDVRIQIVWPHDAAGAFAPVDRATLVNVAMEVFVHGTTLSVPSEAEYPVQLWWARGDDALAPAPFAVQKVTYLVNGQPYARWIVDNVSVEPGEVYHFLATAGPLGDGGTSYATLWTHATEGRTFYPHPQVLPSCAS